ncbi:hypothetical protein SAICODRAFT_18428 [Saitoella complicata NRRL Y-17804]|nr:uncharacterized protein SAICODRAFT_18428 [Saitoella complicata NRRL Y-17804]ODQ53861.1 hypothetical protein SAICODRAFT_18428 [Saitoella complicata NRRL Y-17804]
MLSGDEIAQRKASRLRAERLRTEWAEEVEKRLCEGEYDKLLSIKDSDDEVRDEALASKVAALNILDVTLKHLGVEMGDEEEVHAIAVAVSAGEELQKLNEVQAPKAKIEVLVTTHKILVDGLSAQPSGTSNNSPTTSAHSADLILPILIYTLIKANPPYLVSNLYYIQRFRGEDLLVGEGSYCLTNLEAAVIFLETVDLTSLGLLPPDHMPSDSTGELDFTLTSQRLEKSLTGSLPSHATSTTASLAPEVSIFTASAEISTPHNAPALADDSINSASSAPPPQAVSNLRASADQGLKSLGSALESSYKLFVSRIPDPPKTLDDVRSLVMAAAEQVSEQVAAGKVDREQRETHWKRQRAESLSKVSAGAKTITGSLGRPFNFVRTMSSSFASARPPIPAFGKDAAAIDSPSQPLAETMSTRSMSLPGIEIAEEVIPVDSVMKLAPPRFANMEASELKIGDVTDLLAEYKMMAETLKQLNLFT